MDLLVDALYLLFILFLAKRLNKKEIFFSIFLSIVLIFLFKNIFQVPRPCFSYDFCPTSYSFPSGHATLIFLLVIYSLSTPSFYLYLLFSFFISLQRVVSGVHTIYDIFGSLALAAFSIELTKVFWRLYNVKRK